MTAVTGGVMAWKRRCTARSKRSGEQCRRWATPGCNVCPSHGSKSPQAKAKAKQRLAEQKARSLAAIHLATPVEDPVNALLDIGGQAVQLVEVLRGFVAELERVGYAGRSGEQTKAEIGAYLDSLARAESILANLVRLGLVERRVQIEERQVELMTAALLRVVGHPDLQLTAERQMRARVLLAESIEAEASPA